jgi:threonine aldolase
MNKTIIDLRSDTITKPTKEMLQAMTETSLGDQNYFEDTTTQELEDYCAKLFNKEIGLFMSSGTLSNQIAIRTLTNSGDEIIIDRSYHINYFEAAATSDLGKVAINTAHTTSGILTLEHVDSAIKYKPRNNRSTEIKLICVENTVNTYGGKIFPVKELQRLYDFSRENDIKIHLDGARLFNACAATGISPAEYAQYVDTISICFTKGLGAPFGSILLGNNIDMHRAEKYRHWYGGGLHQTGPLAGAALFGLKNNMNNFHTDNKNAKLLGQLLREFGKIEDDAWNIDTNIVLINTSKLEKSTETIVHEAKNKGLLIYRWSDKHIRAITNCNVKENDIYEAANILKSIL